jgi:hypothetical protein
MYEKEKIGKGGYISYMENLNFSNYINQMLAFDYIIANMDRNTTNFGLIRDNNNLEIIGVAPLFDNGTSLWCNWNEIPVGSEDIAAPFETTHELQIKHITNFDWYEFGCLDGIDEYVYKIFSYSAIPEEIQEQIVKCLLKRIENFEKYVHKFYKERETKISEESLNMEESIMLTPEILKKREDASRKQAQALEEARKHAQEIRTANDLARAKAEYEKKMKQAARQEVINKRNQSSIDKIKKMREEEENTDNEVEKIEEVKNTNPILSTEENGFG